MTSKYRESDKRANGSYAFEWLSRYFDIIHWPFYVALLKVQRAYDSRVSRDSVITASVVENRVFSYRDIIANAINRSALVSPAILKTFSVWYGNASNQDCKAMQRVVRLAECISGSALPSLQEIYLKRCKSRAAEIIKDSNHPGNRLFILLPSGKCFRRMMAKTERLRRSFFTAGHQAPKLNLSLITSIWLNLINSKIFTILHHSNCCYVYIHPVQPVYTFLLHIPAYIMY